MPEPPPDHRERFRLPRLVSTPARMVGATLGAAIGFLLAIAYNTSSQVSVFEGGRRHLTFGVTIIVAAVCAILGAAIASRFD
jgi:hypothetical protein